MLTERGKLVKEIGGHKKYQRHRKRKINILKNQSKINFWLIVAIALAAIMPFFVAKFYPQKIVVNPAPVQMTRQDKPTDSVWLRQQVDDFIQKTIHH